MTLPVSTCRSRIWVIIIIDVVIVDVGVIVKFGIGVVREIMGGTGVLLSVIANVALNNIVDVARTVLIKLQVVTSAFLEDDDSDVDRAEDAELIGLLEETILTL